MSAGGTADRTTAVGNGTPDRRAGGPFAQITGTAVADAGPVVVSAPSLLSQAADRDDVEGELNALRDKLNELLAACRESGVIA